MRTGPEIVSRYDPGFVRALFDEMASTYGIVNLVSSFGFAARWRRQCVEAAGLKPGMVVYDLMSGMGECWPFAQRRIGVGGRIIGVDISGGMCARARDYARRHGQYNCTVVEADALACDLPAGAADAVIACFAVKTLNADQLRCFASRVAHTLRPGGIFSILEISIPPSVLMRVPYRFHLDYVIPRIGQLFLGNPDNYRWLGRYTEAFGNIQNLCGILRASGLSVESRSYFFGCATAVVGRKG